MHTCIPNAGLRGSVLKNDTWHFNTDSNIVGFDIFVQPAIRVVSVFASF